MSDEQPGSPGNDDPRTSIRPHRTPGDPHQPGHPQAGPPRAGQQPYAGPQGQPGQQPPTTKPLPRPEQQWGPPQGQAQGQYPQPHHQQGYSQPGPQDYGQHQAFGPPPQEPAKAKRRKRTSGGGGKGVGIGILLGALALGLAGGFGGAWLKDDGSGGGGEVDADQINTGGLNLQDLVSVQTVADKALPAVVKIEGTRSEGSGSGSGVVISDDGLILTNYHVAWLGESGGSLEVLFNDGSSTEAEIIGTDPSMDIAVIRAQDVSDLSAMEFGAAEDIKVGQAVVAVGSPYGLESTVTAGIISSVNRPVNVPAMDDPNKPMVFPGLQTDAAINPGNSGGALVNIKGELVGMNSANKLAQNQEGSSGDLGSIGIGWAIPINVLTPIIEQLKEGEEATHAWLGIDPSDAKDKGLAQGAKVTGFLDGGKAEDAGVEQGDVVTAMNDYPISNGLGLVTTALQFRPGDTVTLTLLRDGEEQEIEVELAEKGYLFED